MVYNEPYGISPSYLIKKRTANLNDAQFWKIHRLLVALRYIMRRYSVRISKLCMCISLYGIFEFLREFTSHMLYIPITFCTKQIQQSCYEIPLQAFILYLTGVTLCNWRLSYVSLSSYRHNDNLRCSWEFL